MKRMLQYALGALVTVAFCGCTTVGGSFRVTEVSTPQPQAPRGGTASIAVAAEPADAQSRRLADSLRGAVENRLSERGFAVASAQSAHATVMLEVSRRETARLDDWRTYEGTARVRVSTTGPRAQLLGDTVVTANGTRALDEEKAERGVRDGLARRANAWLDKTVTASRISAAVVKPTGVMVTRLSLAPVDKAADRRETLDAQIAFREAVSAVEGIVSCRLMPGKGVATFEIVYEAEEFPDGLMNTLVARLRERGMLERFKLLFRSKGIDIVL